MASVFISHSTADKQAALRLRELLTKNDFQSLFLDSERDDGIAAGKDWERELYVKLRSCRALIALSSKNYVASQWCFAEVAQARALGKRIFPLKLDGAALHPLLLDTQAIDWSGSENEDGVARLMRGLHDAGGAQNNPLTSARICASSPSVKPAWTKRTTPFLSITKLVGIVGGW